MLLRLAIILVIVCFVFRWALGQWPWQMLNPPPTRAQAVAKARNLLGVEEGANREQIKQAHKRLITEVHPDRGGSSAAFHEANEARDLLLSQLPESGSKSPSDDASD